MNLIVNNLYSFLKVTKIENFESEFGIFGKFSGLGLLFWREKSIFVKINKTTAITLNADIA